MKIVYGLKATTPAVFYEPMANNWSCKHVLTRGFMSRKLIRFTTAIWQRHRRHYSPLFVHRFTNALRRGINYADKSNAGFVLIFNMLSTALKLL